MFSLTNRALNRAGMAAFVCAALLFPFIANAEESGSYICPVRGDSIEKVTADTKSSDYNGVRYYFCCAVCKPQFDKNQAKFLKSEKDRDKVNGVSLFDPVTTKRLDPLNAKAHSDFGGVRYFFAKEDDKQIFDKDPKKFAAPKKELLFCPVSNEIGASYAKAADYSDYNGTRYYFCCNGCKPQFDKDQEKYLKGLDSRAKAAEEKKAAEQQNKDIKK